MYDSFIFDVIVEIFIQKIFYCLRELNCGQESVLFLVQVSAQSINRNCLNCTIAFKFSYRKNSTASGLICRSFSKNISVVLTRSQLF